ncbi:MAG: AGE family epimerase/isomerase [Isosphaeraceae bacterium]
MIRNFTQHMSILGKVLDIDTSGPLPSFRIQTRGGDVVTASISENTFFTALQNLDRLDRDRIDDRSIEQVIRDDLPMPPMLLPRVSAAVAEAADAAPQEGPLAAKLRKYAVPGKMIAAEGIYQTSGDKEWYDVKTVYYLYSQLDILLFEHTHWWVTQISSMGDKWLNDLFHDKRSYEIDDFSALYQTNLNILGLPTDDNIQEMATLSRLIYGLSSAYLMSGDIRFYRAARAGVEFQRDAFRSLSADGRFCFWAFGRRKGKYGVRQIIPSENPDDVGSIPLYEQIYALAGMTQFYRISSDWEVLHDIRRTIASFNQFYRDPKDGSYYSHIDYTTFSPHSTTLGPNRSRKNWNSIGDHLPAYLINLIITLDPLPNGREGELREFRDLCIEMLETCSNLIADHFLDPNPEVLYVNERYDADWKPDHSWGWQQNRAVVGHNLKIAWNLTRVANYYNTRGDGSKAEKLMKVATTLGDRMGKVGIDQFRSGCFDAVEREPRGGRPVEFAWGNTKDFWQQEQAILAYLIMAGYTGNPDYLQHAREMEAFWNLFFIDRDRASVFFRVTADGVPVIAGNYSDKGGHAIAGYHSFELNYLAHAYNRAFSYHKRRDDDVFCMHFKIHENSHQRSVNVLPDFFGKDDLEICGLKVNGVRRDNFVPNQFQIALEPGDLGCDIEVLLRPTDARHARNKQTAGA